MPRRSQLRLFSATLLAFALVNSFEILDHAGFSGQLRGDRVEAKSSGGRSRGGSFRRSSPSGSVRPSTPSRPSTPRVYVDPYPYHSYPVGRSYGSSSPGFLTFVLAAGGLVIFGVLLWYFVVRRFVSPAGQSEAANEVGNRDLQNDTVTVTQIQVALWAQARQIQTDLTELTLNLDADTPEGRMELLQESVLALLRSPENWTHVFATSQSFKNREAAGAKFEEISIEERSKFSVETLAKVGGQTRRQTLRTGEEPAAYIVVTLLIGTENDNPLVRPMHTIEELRNALHQISALSPDYLSVFELLWSPQNAEDSLTYDELLTEYPHLVQMT